VKRISAVHCLAAFAIVALVSAPRQQDLPVIEANDNRTPAGALANDTLKISLVVSMARWYPEAADGPYVDVAAFSEEGKAPSIPGPLLRVPVGTTISATVRNDLTDSTIWIRGLESRPAKADSVAIRSGQTRTFTFRAGSPGTFLYYARLGKVAGGVREREQLAGAFVVDTRGTVLPDRIMVINIWGDSIDRNTYERAFAINGKSWPYTERIKANIGDSLRWRVINASVRGHPMHLHGFYFRVDSRGSMLADTLYPEARRRLEVTEHLVPGSTMMMTWTPDRPGNWLYHCHFTFHVSQGARLGFRAPPGDHHDMHDGNPMTHMAGLVMGINVTDTGGWYRPARAHTRKLRMYANEKVVGSDYQMSYVLQRGNNAPSRDSVEKAGQPIVLEQHEPVDVTIINNTHAATAVHWHGIELESFSDGVAGWSGVDRTLAPMIAPSDSFVARLIVPRTGTFIYHTHLNDVEQLTSGAYGPIVIMEPNKRFDRLTDHVITIGWHTPRQPPRLVVNGDSLPAPITMRYNKTQRIRFVNIGPAGLVRISLDKDASSMKWRPVAKDGAALPADYQVLEPAKRGLSTGETFDAEWTPPARGRYTITIVFNPDPRSRVVQPIRVQ
jgi:FtsP/CotA-like multicopper oxidase with cupredoxin domain